MAETILGSEGDVVSTDATILTDDPVVKDPAEKEDLPAGEVLKEGEADGESKKVEDSPADKTEGAPEKYEDFTFPEGVTTDEGILAEASTMFKGLNLTQKQAQELVDFQVKTHQAEVTAQEESWQSVQKEWKDKALSDKEYGGTDMKANMVTAKSGIEAFGNADFKDMLEVTGVGNHPEMIRFLYNVGKQVKEDDILHGGKQAGGPQDQAKTMFPSMN